MAYDPDKLTSRVDPSALAGDDALLSVPSTAQGGKENGSLRADAATHTPALAPAQAQAQTAAPMPVQAPASGSAARIRRRNRMITSCLECRRRKQGCDKSHPCSNCTKHSRDCVFLAPALDSASQLKLTEIKEKMGSLERVLEQDVARNGAWREARKAQSSLQTSLEDEIDFAPIPEDEKELEPSPLTVSDAVYDDDADDDLMDLGIQFGKLRMTDRIGGFFRPKLADEITVSLTDTRSGRRFEAEKSLSPEPPLPALPGHQQQQQQQQQQNYMAPGPTYLPPSSNFFFASNSRGNSLIDYLPAQTAADHLLQQYWFVVHPICRILHRPSFQRRYDLFWNEIRMGMEPAGSLQAVVFAAMFSGVVSMTEEVIWRDFAVPKKDLLENFQQGTETALSRANLLRTTKIETMQAFVMYLIPLCRDQMSRAHSVLVGTAIRLAECMGLHKDGTLYGIGPVETHVRRLIWYQLCMLDIRTCEAQGPKPGIREGEFDTKFPLNVDDNELESESPPQKSSDRWTDMTMTLIRMECNEMMRVIWADRPRLEKKQISLTAVLGKVENFRKVMNEKYLPMLDPSIPIQHAAQLIMRILCARMHIMILHRYHNSVSTRIPARLRQIILTSGTEQLEDAVLFETLPTLQPWSWFAGALQQYQTAFLLLAEIFTYPMRREADRIWRVIDYVFEVPEALSRDAKARLILTEMRDRIGVYRDARKLRASTTMMKRLGQSVPRVKGDPGAAAAELQPEAEERKPDLLFPAQDGEITAPRPAGQGSASNSAGSMSVGMPSEPGMPDDLMADIDWNEWDKLFPPDINTGELNVPVPVPMPAILAD